MNAPGSFELDWGRFSADAFKGESGPTVFLDRDRRFPLGEAGVEAGEGGIGKSFRALMVMEKLSAGGVACIGVFSEDSWANVDRRLQIIRNNQPSTHGSGGYYVTTSTLPAGTDTRLMTFNLYSTEIERLPLLDALVLRLAANKASGFRSLVYLDNLTTLFSLDPNKAEQAGPVMAALNAIAFENDACIVVIHHLTKGGDDRRDLRSRIRGSGGIVDQARFAYVLHRATDDVAKQARNISGLGGDAEIVTVELVKVNGPINKAPQHYWRQPDGYLNELPAMDFLTNEDALVELIRTAAAKGVRYTKSGTSTGLAANRHDGWPGGLGKLGRNALQGLASALVESGRLVCGEGGTLCVPD